MLVSFNRFSEPVLKLETTTIKYVKSPVDGTLGCHHYTEAG